MIWKQGHAWTHGVPEPLREQAIATRVLAGFHGNGMFDSCIPVRSAVLLGVVLLFLSGCQSIPTAPSRKREIHAILARYQEALNQRSVEKICGLLAETVSIDGLTDELSRAGLKAGMHWPPSAITNFQVLSTSKTAGLTSVKAAFYFSKSVLMMRFGLDEDLRIRTIDPVPLWKVPQAKAARPFLASFTESNGLMFVQARVNRRTGFFLVDTGSSGLLLNNKYFQAERRNGLPGFTSTVRGMKPENGSATVRSFEWGELRAGEVRGQLHDFSVMETPAVTPLLGAIGYEQLKACAIRFDWKSRRIAVRSGTDRTPPEGVGGKPAATFGFTQFLHAPAFSTVIGNSTCRMIFDSGAQINLLPNLDGIESQFRKAEAVTRISDGGPIGSETALLGIVDVMELGGITFKNLPFAVFEVPYLAGHGILGSPIIQRRIVEINFPRKTISIW